MERKEVVELFSKIDKTIENQGFELPPAKGAVTMITAGEEKELVLKLKTVAKVI